MKKVIRLLKKRCPAVEAVYLFGSLAGGTPTPKSDADLLVVADDNDGDAVREILSSAPMPVDIFIFSPKSFRDKVTAGKGIAPLAVRQGTRLV